MKGVNMEKAQKELKMMSWPVRLPSNYFNGFLMITHPPVEGGFEIGWGLSPKRDDKILEDVCDYFEQRMKNENLEAGGIIWGGIIPTHAEFVEYLELRNYDMLYQYLSNMFAKPLCHGTAQGEWLYNRLVENKDEIQSNTGFGIYDKFITLFEAVGIISTFSPEQYQHDMSYLKHYAVSPDKYLDMLEESMDIDVSAPKYQGKHFGILTEHHGLYSDRDIMALGIALRISETYWNKKEIKIANVGGGVGYLEYYLHKMGYKNLTMIDLPTVSTSAKFFLDTNLPDHNVSLISPEEFDGNYDLVINCDGLTQFGRANAEEYAKKISKNAKHFLSINREIDEFRVSEIMDMQRISRNPFWYRKGYVEEDYVAKKS
jgi:hypothetical protein